MTKLKKIAEELAQLPADIRAEVLLAQCMEGGLQQNEFMAQADGFFYRSYTTDLYKVRFPDKSGRKKYFTASLSRPGLYDALPEGLFFNISGETKKPKTAGQMAEESRVDQKREMEIRKFFAPFENEFFLHTMKNEIAENGLLQGLRSGWLKEYFIDFWKLPGDIPVTAALVLVMFLPYVHTIAGNTVLTAGVLQKIINEEVKIDLVYEKDTQAAASLNILGNYTLGSELTCGNCFTEVFPVLEISVGPLQKTRAYQYVEGGNYFSLLQTFYNYFIPANAEVKTHILLKSLQEQFILNEKEEVPLLGISSTI